MPSPVAVQVINVGTGGGAGRELLVVGLAESSVEQVSVTVGGASDVVRPARAGAFLAHVAGVADGRAITLRVMSNDGETAIRLPDVPNNAAILRGAEEEYRRGGTAHP